MKGARGSEEKVNLNPSGPSPKRAPPHPLAPWGIKIPYFIIIINNLKSFWVTFELTSLAFLGLKMSKKRRISGSKASGEIGIFGASLALHAACEFEVPAVVPGWFFNQLRAHRRKNAEDAFSPPREKALSGISLHRKSAHRLRAP